MKKALLIIDMQYDFCPNGALAVNGGDEIVKGINEIISDYDVVVATQDWHPAGHKSFASTHTLPIGDIIDLDGINQVLWPDHCVQGTRGAELHDDLDKENINLILRKGMNKDLDSYSAFFENDKVTPTGLNGYLNDLKVEEVHLAGLATDYCVYYSAMDAVKLGYTTKIILPLTRGVDFPEGNIEKSILDMKKNNIEIIK